MLQDGAGLVLLDSFRHHVQNVVHDGRSQLQIKVRLDSLLRHRLGDTLRMTALELAREQVAQPALQERSDAAEEKEPHAPSGRPDAAARAFTDGSRVESVVDEVLEVLAHADLPHELVLVAVHARQLADVGKDVLDAVSELERVHIVESVLDVRVDDELREAQDLSAQMESVSETRLFALLGRQSLDGLQVEVVVQMEIVEVLSVDQQVEHVPSLAANLEINKFFF